jgi:hypothetical protein
MIVSHTRVAMEKTWASGAVELLRHADSHIDLDSAFDKRIAFISIDNCVETSVRTFLSLPESKSGIKVSRAELDSATGSFPKLVALLFERASTRLAGFDPADIEHYHRIRNQLYHEGTGLSVDEQYLGAYRSVAALLLQILFDVSYVKRAEESRNLDALILNWNRIDQLVRARLQAEGMRLIRFGGHPAKGSEDGHHGRGREQEAVATAAYG